MNTPLYKQIKNFAATKGRFHVPGHKGNPAAIPPFGGILPYDITEIEGADDLSNPSGAIKKSQALMAKVYGSGATLYSANGSTSCIQAMLSLYVPQGGQVVMARNCHVSAVRALAVLDADAQWVLPKNGQIMHEDVELALQASGAKTVFITSPDYYGRISDIAAISAVCKKHSAALLVDNAHGAHLHFLQNAAGQSLHPLSLGAAATADSAHKTLPCLTPAAMLHLQNASLAGKARRLLNFYSSTSPSYLVLQSLDLAAALLSNTPPSFALAAQKLAKAAASATHMLEKSEDPLKLCLCPAKGGWPFAAVINAFKKAGITPELADGTRIVLMASPWNTDDDFLLLGATLAQFEQNTPLFYSFYKFKLPVLTSSIRDAVFAQTEEIATKNGEGRTLSSIVAPCPPGMPVVLPGEKLCRESLDLLCASGILTIDVVK